MSSLDRADELQAQADALRELATLEDAYTEAMQAYLDDRTDEKWEAKQAAAEALRAARAESRSEGVSVGGDAFLTNPDEVPQSVQTVHLGATNNTQEG
ncbi:hypothetical protein [Streptosporangium sp. G12]